MLLLGDPPEGKTHSRVACEEIEDEKDAYAEADDEQALYVHIAVEEIYGPVDQDGEGILGAYEAEIAEQLEEHERDRECRDHLRYDESPYPRENKPVEINAREAYDDYRDARGESKG